MKYLIIYGFCFFAQLAFGHDDALKKIKNYSKEDSIKVELIVDFFVNSTFQQSPKILELAQEAESISRKIHYPLKEIHSRCCIGNSYYLLADYPKAVKFYDSSLKKAEKIKSVDNVIIGYNNLANICSKAMQTLKAIELFNDHAKARVFFENALKHGLANKENGGFIYLRFQSDESNLAIEKEDNGIGRAAAGKIGSLTKRKGSSFSTEANFNRIELLNESFGLNIKQEIIDKMGEMRVSTGTKVKIVIPQENI
jgi:tetratricopeptide (TPR) repeat protein